ncbi:putative motility protein [Achromobacter ruhlandii]|nr:putative motility protein [Achromobacter ruhlandii]NMU92490.1 putative motility protein [Achromobacter ruhlandii]
MRDAQLMQEVQARVTKKAINAQADTVATLMQSLPVVAIDGKIGTRINTQA